MFHKREKSAKKRGRRWERAIENSFVMPALLYTIHLTGGSMPLFCFWSTKRKMTTELELIDKMTK